MLEVFKNYVDNYGMDNDKIKRKYCHSIRVMNLSLKYAKILNFSEDDIELAKEIGLLHDIGRFEQIKRYDTLYDSKSIDHANLGVEILFNDNLIDEFRINKDHYEIIKKAIRNHNKYKIESNLNSKELMHAKLIRDIDKIDILYNAAYLGYINLVSTDEDISDLVLEDIRNKGPVEYAHRKNSNDRIAGFFAFIFDINYDECLEELKNYIDVIYNKLEHKSKFEEVYNIINSYVLERIGKKC